MSHLTVEVINRALQRVTPRITEVMRQADGNRSHLHVVVMEWRPTVSSDGLTLERFVVEYSIGDTSSWSYRYDIWARNMAQRTAQSGTLAELVLPGDSLGFGLAVTPDIVVACAGALPYLDKEFATMIVRAITDVSLEETDTDWPVGHEAVPVDETVAYS